MHKLCAAPDKEPEIKIKYIERYIRFQFASRKPEVAGGTQGTDGLCLGR